MLTETNDCYTSTSDCDTGISGVTFVCTVVRWFVDPTWHVVGPQANPEQESTPHLKKQDTIAVISSLLVGD